MRIVVVGGGIMGCATALELSARGAHDILILERAVPGAEASSAAAGMLAAQIESQDENELARFVSARDAYGAWAASLREATGIDVGHRRSGALQIIRDEAGFAGARERVAQQNARGLRAELLDRQGALAVERAVGDDVVHAVHYPDEAQVDPPQLLRALVAAVARAGILVRSGATVSSLVREGNRCVGVALDGHDVVRADAVLLAAGSWSSLVPGIPDALPRVRPVRGQLVMLEERPPALRTILTADHAYVVPRGDGRVVCGSTMEDVGHARSVTAEGVQRILASAIALSPGLAGAELTRTWCNFRPYVTAGRPLVGASPLPGLFLATGHHRNGILLAKQTAEDCAAAVLRG
jgi:glycine oxidase